MRSVSSLPCGWGSNRLRSYVLLSTTAFEGQFRDAGLIEFAFAHFNELGVLLKCDDSGCGIGSRADFGRQFC